jgi:hypothetical protein
MTLCVLFDGDMEAFVPEMHRRQPTVEATTFVCVVYAPRCRRHRTGPRTPSRSIFSPSFFFALSSVCSGKIPAATRSFCNFGPLAN